MKEHGRTSNSVQLVELDDRRNDGNRREDQSQKGLPLASGFLEFNRLFLGQPGGQEHDIVYTQRTFRYPIASAILDY